MNLKKLLSFLICLCIIMTSIPFVVVGSESTSDLPRDIDGNVWGQSLFAKLEYSETKYEGSHRTIFISDPFVSYGSELKNGKYPIVSKDKYTIGYQPRRDNFGVVRSVKTINYAEVQDMWIMEYHSTSSNADRYTICLGDGATYLKDNTGSLPTSGGDMTVTTDKSKATAWDLRVVTGSTLYTLGHDIDGTDPHFVINNESDGRLSLDLSRNITYYFSIYMEMPWYKTIFCYEDGTEYKQDTRQIDGFTVPTGPEKPGYTFLGWSETKGGTNVVYRAGDTLTPTESKSYYPVYTRNTYTVRFYFDSSLSENYKEQQFTYGQSQALLANSYTNTGYRFAGWRNAGNSSQTFGDCATVTNLTTAPNGIINLYALWTEITYTVTFSANGGTGSKPSVTVLYSDDIELPDATDFTREGYTLMGWNTTPEPSGSFAPGQKVNRLTTTDRGTVTLYAIWEALHAHTAGVWETTIPATCTDKGERVRKCTDCGVVVETASIAALGHKEGNYSIINKAASCNGMGEKAWYCERCGCLTKTEAVSPTGHTRGNYVTVKAPTCSEDGIRQEVCSTCGIVIAEEKIPQHTHTPGVWETTIPATCTDGGERVKKCTECGAVVETETIAALGHKEGSYSIINKAASCNGMGEKAWYCERCGCLIKTEAVSPTGHTRGNYVTVKAPTCSEDGIRQEVCSACGIVIAEEIIPKHTHTAGVWETTIPATCTDNGERVKKCTICSVVMETEIIDVLGHIEGSYSIINKAASCNGMGEKAWYCERCGCLIKTEAVSPEGHTPGIPVTKFLPTCKTEGIRTTNCVNCGIVLEEEKIPAHGHTGGCFTTVKSPNCTEDGIKQQVCSTCGIVMAEEIIPAYGHSGELWVTTIEPTCVRPGEKVLQCTSCGNLLKAEEIAPLGHTSGNMKTCADGLTCSVCGIPIENADGNSHIWTEWKTYKEADFFADGQERRFCTICGDEEFRNIDGSAVGLKYIPAISIGAAILIIGGIALFIVSKKKKGNHQA